MVKRDPFRAELLDGSSSISSTTTIVRVALIGRAKKGLQSNLVTMPRRYYTTFDRPYKKFNRKHKGYATP